MLATLEKGVGIRSGLLDLFSSFNGDNVSAGIVAGIFNIGTLLLITKILQEAGLAQDQVLSWIFAVFLGGGFLSIVMALYYKKPICGAWSIAGLVLVSASLSQYTWAEAAGGFFAAGALVFVLGVSGVIKRLVSFLPRPIIMAMIAGILLRFGVGIMTSLEEAPLVSGAILLVFLLSQRFFPRFPGVLAALIAGGVIVAFTNQGGWEPVVFRLAAPVFARPVLIPQAFLGISVPLAITVMGAENMQAMGILLTEGYDRIPQGTKVPINAMTAVSGAAMMVASLAGGHSVNMAGVLTAICGGDSAGPDKEKRYAAAVVTGLITMGFGLFAGTLVLWMGAYPEAVINLIAGLALMGALITSFKGAWAGSYSYGAFFAFITAVSGLSAWGIGAPFWALVLGLSVSFLLDRPQSKIQDNK